MPAPARATMDFFAAQAAARRRTALLVFWFALAVAGTAAAIWAGLSVVVLLGSGPFLADQAFSLDLAAPVAGLVATVTGIGTSYHASRLSEGGASVARMLGGVPVDRATADGAERRLVNVAEEMAIAAGLPVPGLWVLPAEDGINAFAAGLAPDRSVIAVTRGALDRLTRDELQGVVAHEFSHVLNGDARLNVALISVVGGLTSLAMVGRVLVRATSDSDRPRWTRSRRGTGAGAIALAGLVLWVAGSVGALFGRIIRAAVSRQREHLADAAAVQFTRNPDGLAGALAKIAHAGSTVGSAFAPEAAHLFFANGLASSWLSTHPPLKDRIDRILPSGYLRVMRRAQEAPTPAEEALRAEIAERAAALAPAAPAAAAASPLTASTVVESAGRLDPRLAAHAAALLRSLPAEVTSAARAPAGADALVRALLSGGAAARAAAPEQGADPALRAGVERLAAALAPVPRAARMAALELALPALDGLPADATRALAADLGALAAASGGRSVFDWAVLRIVRRRLARRAGAPRPARLASLDEVQVDVLDVLSTLAWAGTREEVAAQAALDTALVVLGIRAGWRVLPRDRIGARRLDAALDRLDGAVPALKARLVEACAAATLFDGRVLHGEAELLRAVAASLGVPVPPVVVGAPSASAAGAA